MKTPDCSVHKAHSQPKIKTPKFGFNNTRQTTSSIKSDSRKNNRYDVVKNSESSERKEAKDTAMEKMSAEI